MASSSPLAALALLFAVGLLLFAIGTALVRSAREPAAARIEWPALIDPELGELESSVRLELIERLALVGTNWSAHVLDRAAHEERDPALREAIARALDAHAR